MSESRYYNYGIKKVLPKQLDSIKSLNNYENIVLCAYVINNTYVAPFLRYMLIETYNEYLSLPKLPVYNFFDEEKLIPYSKVYLSGMLEINNFEEFSQNLLFDGFYDYNNNIYLFFDLTNCKLTIDETYRLSKVKLGLIDEIVNHKNICNIKIDETTTSFFIANESIIYLYDENAQPYEIPIVGFVGKSTSDKLKFVKMFGESPKEKSEILGPYFYFTNFNNAIRQGGWSCDYKMEKKYNKVITDENGKYINGGLVRFAIFLGKTKYIENFPNDLNDESEIKKHRLQDKNLDSKREILTLRISDYDGIWTKNYNSVYLGKLELDDGTFLHDTPIIALKDYQQQEPLSYHYIDGKKLGNRFEEECQHYSIQ